MFDFIGTLIGWFFIMLLPCCIIYLLSGACYLYGWHGLGVICGTGLLTLTMSMIGRAHV